jgi:hypothetical protein
MGKSMLTTSYKSKEAYTRRNCIPMFIGALFTIGKTWNKANCPSTIERINKTGHIYTMKYYYSAIKKNSHVVCRKMDGTGDQCFLSPTQKNTRCTLSLICRILFFLQKEMNSKGTTHKGRRD